jgi:hypothetical protein
VDSPFVLAAALAVFLIVFVRIEFGLYLVIFSMLISPQLGSGGMVAEGRRIVIRSEDILLGRRLQLAREDRRQQGAPGSP